MLLDVIRVFHVSELARELNLDGQSDVFFVAAREGDKFSREPLPPDEHKTFPVPLDFLDGPIIASTITEMLSTVKMLLRRVVQAKLYTKSDRSLDSVPLHWPWPWWVLLRDMFEGTRSTSTTRTRTHVESDASHVARKRKEQHDARRAAAHVRDGGGAALRCSGLGGWVGCYAGPRECEGGVHD